jgi:hypothetical protein
VSLSLRHPQTGEIKVFPEGWSWGCFIGSFLLGAPLFRRGLQIWGAVMVAFNIMALVVWFIPTDRAATLYGWMSAIGLGLAIFFALKANEMAIHRYRSLGWEDAGLRRTGAGVHIRR